MSRHSVKPISKLNYFNSITWPLKTLVLSMLVLCCPHGVDITSHNIKKVMIIMDANANKMLGV